MKVTIVILNLLLCTLVSSGDGHAPSGSNSERPRMTFKKALYEHTLSEWGKYQSGDWIQQPYARDARKICFDNATEQRKLAAIEGKKAGSDQLYETLKSKLPRSKSKKAH